MGKYDSILSDTNERRPKVVQAEQTHYNRYFIIYVLSIIILIVINYIAYYSSVLSPENIIINDINSLKEEFLSLTNPLKLVNMGDEYALDGTLKINETTYSYDIIKDGEKIKLKLSNQSDSLNYYINGIDQYIYLSSYKDAYVKLTDKSALNIFYYIENNYSEYVSSDDYGKSIYLENNKPVVEVTLSLSSDIFSKITGNALADKYNIILTFKNDALTDEIISIKAIINNETDNTREVFTYSDNTLTYVDSGGNTKKYVLSKDDTNFTLKIYYEDSIYSVLTGTNNEDSYVYSYQIIDQVYNITLKVSESDESYVYDLTSTIEYIGEKKTNTVSLIVNYTDVGALAEDINGAINYSSLSDEEKTTYEDSLSSVIGILREFIDEY